LTLLFVHVIKIKILVLYKSILGDNMFEAAEIKCFEKKKEELIMQIIKDYTQKSEISPEHSLVEIGISDTKDLARHIGLQNPTVSVTMEARLGLGAVLSLSKNFIGKPRSINTVGDLIKASDGIVTFGA
jgi:hypothetical protein